MKREDIVEVLKMYPLGYLKTYRLFYEAEHKTYKITTSKGTFIFKVVNKSEFSKIKTELSIISLLKKNIPHLVPIKNNKGEWYAAYSGFFFIITPFIMHDSFPWGKGYLIKEKLVEELGAYHALLHKIDSKKLKENHRYNHLRKFFSKMGPCKEKELAENIFSTIDNSDFNERNLPRGFIHADFHSENVLIKSNKIIAVIDFELACKDAFIYDIGLGILDFCFTKENKFSSKRMNTFLRGYEKIRKLSKLEKKHIDESILIAGIYVLHFMVREEGINKKNLRAPHIRRLRYFYESL